MPLMLNTVTGKKQFMPASYIGQFPFALVEEAAPVVETAPAPTPEPVAKPKKKKAEYAADAIDADGDGRVQDGTPFEREAGTELSPEELTAIEAVTDAE